MAISSTKYVSITSAVGGNNSVEITDLITRCFSENVLIPTGGVALEFTSAAAVGSYFGTSSVEYLRAVFYFGWISKQYNQPEKISYARWANANTAPHIFGAQLTVSLADLQEITTGAFALTLGATTNQITGLDFSAAATFADVAAAIQVAIRTHTGTQWTAATVVYSATPGAFNFTGGDTSVAAAVSVAAPASGVNISGLIGWLLNTGLVYPETAIWSNGVQAESITQALSNSQGLSNNFGSFLFVPVLNETQIVEAATWNLSLNNLYMYLVPAPTLVNATDYADALLNIGGSGITYAPHSAEYPEMAPGMILAATNYDLPNASQNYMFQQNFNLTASVSDNATAASLDAVGVNYYGLTQNAGLPYAFYQNGVLTGAMTSTNPTDMNTYANEIWFKNAATAAFLTLLLNSNQVSANTQGVNQVLTSLQGVIDQATVNGVISIQGFLSQAQIATITAVTNDPEAWHQVQTLGYWNDCVIEPYVIGEYTYYRAVYTFVYKKNDAIRQIIGTDILI